MKNGVAPATKSSTAAPLAVCLLTLLLGASSIAFAQNTASPLPAPTGFVNDFANVVDPASKSRLETILKNLKERADIEFAVATVKTTGQQDIFDYSLAVARGWGIGPGGGEKNGLLLLVAVDDRKYFFQVARHLEGDLPDGYVGEVGRRMRDPFRANRYGEGISNAVQTIVATLGRKRGFNVEGIDQERYALRERSSENAGGNQKQSGGISTCTIAFIIIVVLIIVLSSRGGGGSGCLNLCY
ncbi:MAG: TPM domain-containing protein [Pyrinomonadaceae bacterium]